MLKIKNMLAFSLVLILMLSLGVPAFADGAKNAADFVAALEELEGTTCTMNGTITSGGEKYEQVEVEYTGEISDYKSTFTANFAEDGSEVIFSIPLLTFDEDNLVDVLVICNEFNAATTSVKTYVDTDDNRVMEELYLLVTDDSALDLALTGMGLFIAYSDIVYEALEEYAV